MGVEVLYYVLNSESPLSEVPLCTCVRYTCMYMYSILSVGSLVVPVWSMYSVCAYMYMSLYSIAKESCMPMPFEL